MANQHFTPHAQDTIDEEWRNIPGVYGYQASSLGRIRRVVGGQGARVGRIRQPSLNHCGYLTAALQKDGKRQGSPLVHCHVAAAFLGACPEGYEVNHINGDKTDNRVSNLEYVTHQRNMDHAAEVLNINLKRARGEKAANAKLSNDKVRSIRSLYLLGHTRYAVAKRYGVDWTTIDSVIKGETWKHVD
jgi:hypothetical protein